MPPPDHYYVYAANIFDSIYSISTRFGVTAQALHEANPQWGNQVKIFFAQGEQVILPASVEKSPLFFLLHFGEVTLKRRGDEKKEDKKPKEYPADWFPPKPAFGSPSKPLSALLTKLDNPKYVVTKPGTYHSPIKFTDGWDTKNVSKVFIPQLKGVPFYSLDGQKGSGNISFYTKAHAAVKNLFKAWEDEGLISKILTFEGSFNPRVIKSGNTPSNHSFGTAFDINGSWNAEGKKPAGIGKKGCLLELVPIASEHGFYWGGFYEDAMHFEYAKL